MKYNPQFENKYSISIISWIRKLMPSWGMHDLCNIASYLAPNPGFDGLSFKFNFISVFSITPLLKMEKAKQLLNVSLLGVLSFFLFSLVLNYYFFFFFLPGKRHLRTESWCTVSVPPHYSFWQPRTASFCFPYKTHSPPTSSPPVALFPGTAATTHRPPAFYCVESSLRAHGSRHMAIVFLGPPCHP